MYIILSIPPAYIVAIKWDLPLTASFFDAFVDRFNVRFRKWAADWPIRSSMYWMGNRQVSWPNRTFLRSPIPPFAAWTIR